MHNKLATKLVITLLILAVAGLILSGGCQEHREQDSATSPTAARLSSTLVPDTDLDVYIYAEQNSPTVIPSGMIGMTSDIEVESFAVWGASAGDKLSFGLGLTLTSADDASRVYDEVSLQDDFWIMLSENTLYAVYGSGTAAERLKTAISNHDFKYYNDSDSLAMAATLPDYDTAGPFVITLAKPTEALKDFMGQYIFPGYLEPLDEMLESAHVKIIAVGLYSPQQINVAQVTEIFSSGSSIADLDLGMLISVKSTYPSFLVEPAARNYLKESGFTEIEVGGYTLFKGGWSFDDDVKIPVIARIEGNLILVAVAGEESYAEALLTNGSMPEMPSTSPSPPEPVQPIPPSSPSTAPEPVRPTPPSSPQLPPEPVRPTTPASVTANIPTGSLIGEVNQTLTFSTGSHHNIDGVPEYRFDWGDGGRSDWSSSYSAAHSWSSPGTYTIKARARISDTYSDWSSGKTVTIEASVLDRSPLNQPEEMMSYITPDDPQIESAVDDILSGYWRWAYSDFNSLREWVSTHVTYKYDDELHGVSDYWQLPSETLELGKGDCEDFAILLCTLLRSYGVPPDQVYVAAAFSEGDHGHAFLFERYYTGIWRAIEPQAGVWQVFVMGDIDPSEYDRFYCFNDQEYLTEKPSPPFGTYEFEADYSFWPATSGAKVEFERHLDSGEEVTGLIEWGKDSLGEFSDMVYDWTITVYNRYDNAVFTWSGNDLSHEFSFTASQSGMYRIEILKRDYLARYGIMTIEPEDWVQN